MFPYGNQEGHGPHYSPAKQFLTSYNYTSTLVKRIKYEESLFLPKNCHLWKTWPHLLKLAQWFWIRIFFICYQCLFTMWVLSLHGKLNNPPFEHLEFLYSRMLFAKFCLNSFICSWEKVRQIHNRHQALRKVHMSIQLSRAYKKIKSK